MTGYSLAALSFEISWSIVTGIFAALGVIATGIAYTGFKVYQKWKELNDTSSKEALKKREKLAKEEAELRETLLGRYKDLYDLTRNEATTNSQQCQDKITRLNTEITELEDKLKRSKDDTDRIREENKNLIVLNLEYQTNKSQDALQIRDLSDSINRLKAGK